MLYIYNTNQRQLFLNHKIILILKMELVVGTFRVHGKSYLLKEIFQFQGVD